MAGQDLRYMLRTMLQMLLRGQNILGYKHYSDDVVRRFVRVVARNGIDIVRIFDALNGLDNLKVAIESIVKTGSMKSAVMSSYLPCFCILEGEKRKIVNSIQDL